MSGCGCIYIESDNGPEVYTERMVIARKNHTCCECGEAIEKGDKYEYVTGLWDGDWRKYKTCVDCLSVRQEFFCDSFVFTEIWSAVWEHVMDMCGEISSDCFAKLTSNAKQMLCKEIEEYWEKFCDDDDESEVPE